ncbi:MAG: hypothetical protein Q8O03_05570 [Nanoarchaeota archaeon]|nr:hypothetical protein [Nanoarchaeota archaeon]
MSKRGQVFILAAILLAVILFSLSVIRNKFEQREIKGDFEALSENFQIESSKLINSVIDSGADANKVQESFKSFSTMFTSYAKGKNPEYGLIYVLSFGDKIQVTNFLDREIIIQGCNPDTGNPYSVNVSGGFGEINADLNFEDFNIQAQPPVVPINLDFGCSDLWGSWAAVPQAPQRLTEYCVFLPQPTGLTGGTKTEFSVIIGDVSYYLCVEKGVPELMQVSTMKQGEQAKVKGTGKCINQDFCSTLSSSTRCNDCGEDACFWWTFGTSGLCLSRYAYPGRLSGECLPDVELCSDDSTSYLYDTCKKEIEKVKTCIGGEVCRDSTDLPGLTTPQCCVKHPLTLGGKICSGNDVHWFSSCNTVEDRYDECQDDDEVCHENVDSVDAKCCKKESYAECYNNDIYWYSDCKTSATGAYTQEGLAVDCNEDNGWVCRDISDGLTQAQCCIKNEKKTCYQNDIYYNNSCGLTETESLFEDCVKYCNPETNECCVQQGRVCSADSKTICDYYGECGNKDCTSSDSCIDCSCTCGGYNTAETIANGNCADGKDNNCKDWCDYDSNVCSHGDPGCPVGVTGISVSPSIPIVGTSITVDCTSTVASVNSISASIDGVGSCTWQSWNGNVVKFSCPVGSVMGSRTVKCYVDTAKSYKSGSDQTKTINVLPSDCSAYSSSSSCDADSRCDWCLQCSGVKYTGGVDRCVSAGSCPVPYCWKNQCSATCDLTNGGCNSPYTCDSTTCSCVCTPATCSSLDKQCGSWSDGCGGTLNCGSCPSGYGCASDGKCKKQFQCECEKYSGDGLEYAELTPQCINLCGEGATCKAGTVGGGSGDRYCTCINTYWTGCSAIPSCNSDDTKLAEQACTSG